VASTLHTTSEHAVSSITNADAHTSTARSWLSWRPRRFKWTGPFRQKTKSGFCACAITFQLASTIRVVYQLWSLSCSSAGILMTPDCEWWNWGTCTGRGSRPILRHHGISQQDIRKAQDSFEAQDSKTGHLH